MKLEVEQLDDGTTKVSLFGRMDIAGADEIAIPFTSATAVDRKWVMVDLSGVDFMASIGVRSILQNARGVKLRGGAMVLVGPTDLVAKILESAGVGNVVPIVPDIAAARTALLSSQ
jgi:anti-anti-sigma factor